MEWNCCESQFLAKLKSRRNLDHPRLCNNQVNCETYLMCGVLSGLLFDINNYQLNTLVVRCSRYDANIIHSIVSTGESLS